MKYSFKINNASSTIAAGTVAQTALADASAFNYLFIQNPRAETETLRVDYGATATTVDSVELGPGDAAEFTRLTGIPEGLISVLAATTGHKYILKWG